MTIKLVLSESGINSAVKKLTDAKDNLLYGVEQTIDILTKEGAILAQSKYGGMAAVSQDMPSQDTGVISTSGDTNIIAEFGAGDATLDPSALFENDPKTPVFSGAYSLLEGSKEYWEYGRWHFGGRVYTEVEPRLGLYSAKEYIKAESTRIAKEVIRL